MDGTTKSVIRVAGMERLEDERLDDKHGSTWDHEIVHHPLIRYLGDMMAKEVGVRILVVFPTATGWAQVYGDTQTELMPRFCRLFQASPEGGKHCRMCHILMTVAACSRGSSVQRCHAGAASVVCPTTSDPSEEASAILSSCTFADTKSWKEVAARAKQAGADVGELRKAYDQLPKLTGRQRQMLEALMRAMALAIQEIKRRRDVEARVRTMEQGRSLQADIERLFKKTDVAGNVAAQSAESKDGHMPPVIRVVRELICQRPELPLTVKELAAAARMTPNHFTSLFGRWTGQAFTEFIVAERMERAKKLLADLTLNINEVAQGVGYGDPGYFARRFRQVTGFSPRAWRARRPPSRPAAKRVGAA